MQAEAEVDVFLTKDHTLGKYSSTIDKYTTLSTEIMDMRPRIPLNLLCLDASSLHSSLADRSTTLANLLTGRYDCQRLSYEFLRYSFHFENSFCLHCIISLYSTHFAALSSAIAG